MMCYVSTGLPKFVQDSTPNPLPELLRYQSWLFELTTSMRVQKVGFQNQEG
ncbi:hypothetical protein M2444_002653 [Paenibacillus sp. PastF-3]|uniref:hypothetical protein n=1 Tax=Paenibacillus sp. PastF-3 TaxID=2940626 RepID=UPI00247363E1|nr:hypothetical protein [Paenibacillus sp. PastF-3]MDH6370868.1 hypothetical protein [Paenibacillus sp. PastF-3]